MGSDGVEDVTIVTNSSPSKILGSQYSTLSMLPTFGGVMCAKASMLLQVNSCLLLIRLFQSLHISSFAFLLGLYLLECSSCFACSLPP